MRPDLIELCGDWLRCKIYDAGMSSITKDAKTIGSVDQLMSFLKNKKYNKRKTNIIFIEFLHDFQELKTRDAELEKALGKEYIIVNNPKNRALQQNIFRIIGNSLPHVLIVPSRFAKKDKILLI